MLRSDIWAAFDRILLDLSQPGLLLEGSLSGKMALPYSVICFQRYY